MSEQDELSMKPLLSVAVQEAVKLALVDSVLADGADEAHKSGEDWWKAASRLRAEWTQDVFAIPGKLIARMDPMALAQNVCCRLLGTGGWTVNGVYSGNATAQQILDASIVDPRRDRIGELGAMLSEHTGLDAKPLNPDDFPFPSSSKGEG